MNPASDVVEACVSRHPVPLGKETPAPAALHTLCLSISHKAWALWPRWQGSRAIEQEGPVFSLLGQFGEGMSVPPHTSLVQFLSDRVSELSATGPFRNKVQ